ncbi:cytochrome P450 [Thelephora terrestris]|uniref:Cytochrome P450 n=1 Tax=Thelephora terrestris TaxID=56493 RepID=A0A9P6HGC7_9AGAM|nr:cytochrome P450 [Thelephora terrestris]
MSLSEKYMGSVLAAVTIAIVLALAKKKRTSRRLPYPPGPKGYPIIGNLLDLPGNPIWEGLARMNQEYNTDILHLDLMGGHMVVLSNSDLAVDLMVRRSLVYADRIRIRMGCSWAFSLMSYGSAWRIHRKLFHRFFSVAIKDRFDDKMCDAVNVFIHRLSESPEKFLKHAHFLAGSLALSVAYGLNIESENDKVYSLSEDAMNAVDIAMVPGRFLVDFFPILKHVPEWFPGAGFKKFARMAKEDLDDSINLPFLGVKDTFQADATTTTSVVATCLEELPDLSREGVDEEVVRNVGGIVFLGNSSPICELQQNYTQQSWRTASSIKSFFLAVTLHPNVVHLAQKELDEVVGGDRSPDFSDKSQLPYISAIVKEVLRWRPPAPLAPTRRVMEDDVYKGLFIPTGTVVVGNIWAMFRDESVYPDAHVFNPGRFIKDGHIDPNVKDPQEIVFGWGRRICPGRHFVLRVLWLTIARVLATFDISKCLDEDGNPITPNGKYTSGGITHPLPFRSDIKPRSPYTLSPTTGH